MQSRSIEKIIIIKSLISIELVLIIAGALLDWLVIGHLYSEFDKTLLAKAANLQTLIEYENGHLEFDFDDAIFPEFSRKKNPEYFQIWIENNGVFERSRSLKNNNNHKNKLTNLPIKTNRVNQSHYFKNSKLPDGRMGRMIQMDFHPQIGDADKASMLAIKKIHTVLIYAKERESFDHIINIVHSIFFAVIFITALIIAFIIRLTVRGAFIQLKDAEKQIESLDSHQLTIRLEPEKFPAELDNFVKHFNLMLNRLETSFIQERQFASDIAHELRTPITEILTTAEVALKWFDDRENNIKSLQDILNASQRMRRLVSNLLSLSRCESGLLELSPQTILLSECINTVWNSVQSGDKLRSLEVKLIKHDAPIIIADVEIFQQLLSNIFSNAIAYSPINSTITINEKIDNSTVSLEISNEQNNLEPDDLALLFNHMWRKDSARTSDQHAGLGLALVKAYAEILGIKVNLQLSNHNSIFRVTLSNIRTA